MALAFNPKFVVSREVATTLVPDLVKLVLSSPMDLGLWAKINAVEIQAKKGQEVIVAVKDHGATSKTLFIRARVSLVSRDGRNEDGPVIRVKAGNLSWRVDGNDNFLPVE